MPNTKVLPLASFALWWQSWKVVMETIWPTGPKTFTIYLFTEKVCRSLFYSISAPGNTVFSKLFHGRDVVRNLTSPLVWAGPPLRPLKCCFPDSLGIQCSLQRNSEAGICMQEVHCGTFLGSTPLGVKTAGLGRGRSWAVMWMQWNSGSPEAAVAFSISNWGKGASQAFKTHMDQSVTQQAGAKKGHDLEQDSLSH